MDSHPISAMTSTPTAAENSFVTLFGIVKSRPRNEIWVASSLTRTTISRTSKTPRLRRSLLPMSPQSACVWRRLDRTGQLFRLPRSPLCGGGRRCGLPSPAPVMPANGGGQGRHGEAPTRESPAASLKGFYGYASNTPGARNGPYTDPMLEGQIGNLPGTSKQQLRIRSVLDVPADTSQRPPSTAASAPPAARFGTAVNPSYPRPWANRITNGGLTPARSARSAIVPRQRPGNRRATCPRLPPLPVAIRSVARRPSPQPFGLQPAAASS